VFLHRHFVRDAPRTELEDVVRNLGYVLGAKEGCGSFLRGFGLSETGYRTPEQMLVDLSKELRVAIGSYEPRVEIVEIEEVYGDDGRVSLAVHCRLRSTGERLGLAVDPASRAVEVQPGAPTR
jgi:predicted component of type VI protein secretion system